MTAAALLREAAASASPAGVDARRVGCRAAAAARARLGPRHAPRRGLTRRSTPLPRPRFRALVLERASAGAAAAPARQPGLLAARVPGHARRARFRGRRPSCSSRPRSRALRDVRVAADRRRRHRLRLHRALARQPSVPTRGCTRPTSPPRRSRSRARTRAGSGSRAASRSTRATCCSRSAGRGPVDLVVSNPPYVDAARPRHAGARGARPRAGPRAVRSRARPRRSTGVWCATAARRAASGRHARGRDRRGPERPRSRPCARGPA